MHRYGQKCMITFSVGFCILWCKKKQQHQQNSLPSRERNPFPWPVHPPVLCADGESSSQTDWGSSLALILGRDAEDPLALPWRWEEDLIIGCYLCVTATRSERRRRECLWLWSVRLLMAQALFHAPSWNPNTTSCRVLLWAQHRRVGAALAAQHLFFFFPILNFLF